MLNRLLVLLLLSGCLCGWAIAPGRSAKAAPDEPARCPASSVDCGEPLLLEKSVGPSLAAPGATVTYTLRATNQTTATLASVLLTDTLPTGLIMSSASDGGVTSGGVVHWPATTLSPGATLTRTLHAQVDPALVQPPVLFFDDMESDNYWRATGLWQRMTDDGPCANSYSPGTSWYYGQSSDCTYDTGGPNAGELTLIAPITLPAGESKLTFWSWQATEPFEEYDRPVVRIATDGESFSDLWYWADNTATWQRISVDLTAYAGQAIWLQFALNTQDEQHNHYPGWYVDDVQVVQSTPFLVNTATATASAGVTATATATLIVVPPPVHDDFAARRLINGPNFHDWVETTTATVAADDPVAPCTGSQGSRTVWYEFTPAVASYLRVETTGSSYPALATLWRGERGALTNGACLPPTPTDAPLPVVEAGVTYYLAVTEEAMTAPALERRYLQLTAALIPLPALVVEPTAVAATLQGRGTVTQTVWISNSGGADLHFDLAWRPGVTTTTPWLTVTPLTGTVAGASGLPVQLTFAAEPLRQAGVYTGLLMVASNDEATGEVAVPVTLTVIGPQLTLGDATIFADQTFTVPLTLATNGLAVVATTFAVSYDPTCLHVDPTDGNGDGLPDALHFALPTAVQTMVQMDPTAGRINLFLADTTPPLTPLPDGVIATLTLTARCRPVYGAEAATALTFAVAPPPSFSDPTAHALLGRTQAGAIVIQPALAGDCNDDGAINAADPVGVILEIFDEDGQEWLAAAGGSFPGNPPGCDANRDATIDAADLICTVLVSFNGAAACALPATAADATGATLSLPATLTANAGQTVALPVRLAGGGQRVAAAIFALDFDPTALHFDPTDRNHDGVPDAVIVTLPAGVTARVNFDAGRHQLQFVLSDFTPPLTPLPDGVLAVIEFTVPTTPAAATTRPTLAAVTFAPDPPASLGADRGQRLPVTAAGGAILILHDDHSRYTSRLYLPVVLGQ
ncbi:MAG: DUF11 domain-containing protein [Caldilinea sp. CFX5]|nr:DUF11 domain-containing protein [Caldilinea sp. CFX5]